MSIKALGLDTSSHGLDILSRGLTVLCRGFDILSRDFAISSCGFCTLSCYLYISSQDLNIILTSWRTIKTEIYQVRMSLTGQYIIYIYIFKSFNRLYCGVFGYLKRNRKKMDQNRFRSVIGRSRGTVASGTRVRPEGIVCIYP